MKIQENNIIETSYIRANIIAWLPITEEDEVLYIGTEQDMIAQKLVTMAKSVTCIREDDENLLKERKAAPQFDYVICIGVLARLAAACGKSRMEGAEYAVKCLRQFTKDNGRLILAVSNRLGLKYLAGRQEEGSSSFFAGIEGENEIHAYSKRELNQVCAKAEFKWVQYYYPFPDYTFAMNLYSPDYLPKQGELVDQVGNFDERRLVLFDEAKAFDLFLAEGEFETFANAFLLIVQKEKRTIEEEKTVFVKFSNDRGTKHNIRTIIKIDLMGEKHLIKIPDSREAAGQILGMAEIRQMLLRQYQESNFLVNRYLEREDGLEFEFLAGETIEAQIDKLLVEKKEEEACERILEVASQIRSYTPKWIFAKTDEFKEVFGDVMLPEGLMASPVSDIDMVLSNIIVTKNGWNLIDYEWSFPFPIPTNYIVYRMIHYFVNTTSRRRVLKSYNLFEKAGIRTMELPQYERMEENFQSYILDGHVPLRTLYKEKGKPAYYIQNVWKAVDCIEKDKSVKFYFDRGEGFREDDTQVYLKDTLDTEYEFVLPIDDEVKQLRIDPGSEACTVCLNKLAVSQPAAGENKREKEMTDFITNGHKISKDTYLFATEDPNILLTLPDGKARELELKMKVDSMNADAAELFALKADRKYRLKKFFGKA